MMIIIELVGAHFGISFFKGYLFSFLFTDENNFPDLLEIPINSDMQ